MKEMEAKHSFKIFRLKNSNKRLVIGEELSRGEQQMIFLLVAT